MKTNKMRPLLLFIALVLFTVVLAGCGVPYDKMSAKEIYAMGQEKYDKGKYSEAIEAYEALIDLYPFSVLVTKAELGVADAYYKKRRYAEAIPAYEDWLQRHPTNEKVPHVLYNLGMSHYELKLAIDRDQTDTFAAEKNLFRLVTDFSGSEYYGQAKEKLSEVRKDLAKRERYIAKFYYREKEYYAALRRYNRVIRNYPDTEYFSESLYYSGICYYELGETDSARQQFELLATKFPGNKYAKKAKKFMEKLPEKQ